jgi:hypothetical protein
MIRAIRAGGALTRKPLRLVEAPLGRGDLGSHRPPLGLRGDVVGSGGFLAHWRLAPRDIPVEHEAQVDWLFAWWGRVDEWIQSRRPNLRF